MAATAIVPPLLELVRSRGWSASLRAVADVHQMKAPSDHDPCSGWTACSPSTHPWKHTCLRRSAILYYLLRSAGQRVDLCIGVRRGETGELLAHAWLRRDGEIYLERGNMIEDAASYTLIAQFPGPA